jgi:methionine synthase II (cobalamin-independent)
VISNLHPHVATGFVPAGAVTGIGSLPIHDPAEAVEFVATYCPTVPFCPQPPSGDLTDITLAQLSGPEGDEDTALRLLVEAARRAVFSGAIAFKTQLTGPITLASLLKVERGDVLTPAMLEALASVLARRASQQVELLRPTGLPVLVFVDEPALAMIDPLEAPFARNLLSAICDAVRTAGGIPGLHCCAIDHPGELGEVTADVLSFDATSQLEPNAPDKWAIDDVRRLMAFGLIGVTAPFGRPDLAFSRWLMAAAQTTDAPSLARRTMITTSCGLGSSTRSEAEAAFQAAAEVSALVGAVAQEARIRV